jgi:hypothetical protein
LRTINQNNGFLLFFEAFAAVKMDLAEQATRLEAAAERGAKRLPKSVF